MKRILIISADKFEDTELLVPYYRMKEAGHDVTVSSIRKGKIVGKHGYEVKATKAAADLDPADYDALVLPGGKAPAVLRERPEVLEIARSFMKEAKPVAAICHGPQILISAGVLGGRRATSYESVKPEMEAAEVRYEDREVIVDKNLVTSRKPQDLPAFMREFMKKLKPDK
jgi:protease I